MKKFGIFFFLILLGSQILTAQKTEYVRGHKSDGIGLFLSQSEKKLVSYSFNDGICLWDLPTNQLIWKKSPNFVQKGNEYYTLTTFAFSPDEKFIASGSGNGSVQLWDASDGKLLWRSDAHRDSVTSVKFSPDGETIVSAAAPKKSAGEVKILKASDGQILRKLEGDSCTVVAMAFEDDGKILKAGTLDGNILSWDFQTGGQLSTAAAEPCRLRRTYEWEVSFSNDLQLSATRTGEKELTVKNTESGEIIKKLPVSAYRLYSRFSANKQKIVVGTYGGLLIHNLPTGENQEMNEIVWGDSFLLNADGRKLIKNAPGKKDVDQYIAVIELDNPKKSAKLVGGKIVISPPTALEQKLLADRKLKQSEIGSSLKQRDEQAEKYIGENKDKITAKFSHYGDAESFWDQKIAESGAADKSKLKLPKEKAKVAWFTFTNDSDLPVLIDTNSMIFNPQCRGLCDGAEISSRYVLELKDGKTTVNGYDMYSRTILPPKITAYFSVSLEHFAASRAIYLGFTFQKDNPDNQNSNDYGTGQKLYLPRESDLPQ
jgi:hypothetical protein